MLRINLSNNPSLLSQMVLVKTLFLKAMILNVEEPPYYKFQANFVKLHLGYENLPILPKEYIPQHFGFTESSRNGFLESCVDKLLKLIMKCKKQNKLSLRPDDQTQLPSIQTLLVLVKVIYDKYRQEYGCFDYLDSIFCSIDSSYSKGVLA